MNMFTTLNQVRKFLDNFNLINHGGCGVAALSMYRWLKKNDLLTGDECFVFLYQSQDSFYDTNEKFFKGENKEIVSCSHVVLKKDNEYFDSTDKNRASFSWRYSAEHDNVSEDNLINALNTDCWNSSFIRELSIPIIELALGIDLSDIIIYFLNRTIKSY